MSLRLGALQDALSDPGNLEKARAAAEEVAGYERTLVDLRSDDERTLADLRSDVRIMHWMMGVLIALVMGGLWLSFNILSRLP